MESIQVHALKGAYHIWACSRFGHYLQKKKIATKTVTASKLKKLSR